ncbi:MAG: IPTL-CTERM sorting domain-containing protein [Phycisphaerae bacterium]
MRLGMIIATVLLMAAMPLAVMAQAPAPGVPHEYIPVDHTNTPIYTVDDVNMVWAPIGLGRDTPGTALPQLSGPVYSNMSSGSGFVAFQPAANWGADDHDSIKTTTDLANMDGFRFVGGVVTAYDIMLVDHFEDDATTQCGVGAIVDSWGLQLPYGGNFIWTITQLGLVPLPDNGWVQMSSLPYVGAGTGQWFMSDAKPNIGTQRNDCGGASGGAFSHKFELSNILVPDNDTCKSAEATGAIPSTTLGNNVLAASQTPSDPCSAGMTSTVWYTVIGTGTTLTAELCDDNLPKGIPMFDGAMTVSCAGCNTKSPVCLDINDDGPCGRFGYSPSISWCTSPGEVYHIGLGSFFGDSGDFKLDITSDGTACSTADACIACGDGELEPGEECDDGNLINDDRCDDQCRLECGNKFRNPLEDCDDGNREDGDGCSSTCEFEGSVPTISQWGMLVLGTLLLIGLTVKFRRRATATA